jgi:hypothetical protein
MRNNENLNDDRVKSDEHQYSNIDGKIISNESSKASSSQSKSIDIYLLVLSNISDSSAFFLNESLMKITSSKMNCFELHDNNKNKVCRLNYRI